jgi:K+-transporting ATPase ATPase A chain
MKRIYSGEKTFITPIIRPIETGLYKLSGIDESSEMNWKTYGIAFTLFTFTGIAVLFLIQLLQNLLPFNPQGFAGVKWDSALNTAISFATNTNWQGYGGENTMSYFTQMIGLTVQNFLSAGAGMAAGVALIRGFMRKESETIGNFWVDLSRSVLYILFPLSILTSVILMSQGVVQSFQQYITAETLEGGRQLIPLGPAASQIATKQLGTNGGGFFSVNSAYPFENPTFISNLMENISILIIPIGFVFMFGSMINNKKQGRAIFLTMTLLFLAGLAIMLWSENSINPVINDSGIAYTHNMEGKETRFGVMWSALWSQSTTATSNGSVNSMHDSYMPLSGMVQLFNMGIGEVIYGGAGVGFAGFIFYIILSMFIAGLMVGRTPEFLGKKLGPREMTISVTALLLPMITAVLLSAIAVSSESGLSGLNNKSAHGLSEILYAYFSTAGNNGSAFAGLNSNTLFYNLTLSAALLAGRFATVIPALAIAGSLAVKKTVPDSSASFPTTGILFIVIVSGVIIIMGALTFFPVITLGPFLEHLFMKQGVLF